MSTHKALAAVVDAARRARESVQAWRLYYPDVPYADPGQDCLERIAWGDLNTTLATARANWATAEFGADEATKDAIRVIEITIHRLKQVETWQETAVADAVWNFDVALGVGEKRLQDLTSEVMARAAIPKWDRDSDVLTLEGRVCRYVRKMTDETKGVRSYLNQMESNGWPEQLKLSGNADLKDVVKSLNQDLELIRFSRSRCKLAWARLPHGAAAKSLSSP